MKLSVITPSFNGEQFIKDYLDSLVKNLPDQSEIIIVDNGSSDQTREIIKKYRQVKLIENPTNEGFSKANNAGARVARGEHLLFLNQDIIVSKDSIEKMLSFADQHPEVGVIAPKLIGPDGKIQESVANLPTFWRAVAEYIFNQKKAYEEYAPKGDREVEVESAYGAAFLIKKDLFEDIGGWDERYFIYYEDLELCRQVKRRGFKIMYLPNVEFKHLLGASQKKMEPMPFGIRTLSWFWPIKKSGSRYYMLQSARIYHGILVVTLIRLIIYLRLRLR